MKAHVLRWGLVLVLFGIAGIREASAQGPTVDSGLPPAPGSSASTLGTAPGAGGGTLVNPGDNSSLLGGRAGPTMTRAPASVSNPSLAGSPTALQMGIAAAAPTQRLSPPLFGSLSLPQALDYEGPANGMTLDDAIDRLLRDNLDLRGKFYEIPQAQADILQAGLRANPVFYADSQLVPYGRFNRVAAGGPTQYDVNVSYPFDVSHKRQARVQVATRAKRVLEAQYQDAVRGSIDNLYGAFVDVLSARLTVIYAKASLEGLNKLLDVARRKLNAGQATRAEVGQIEIQRDTAQIGLLDSEEQYRKAKRSFAILLNIAPVQAESLEVRGGIFDKFPPPPPLDVLDQIALSVRPDIVSYRLGVSRAEADVKLALANRFTDVYVLYQPYTYQNNEPYGLKSATSWALGVTVPIPLYNRNQGAIQRAKLNVSQTQIQLQTLEHQTVTDVAQAYREYELTRMMVEKLRTELLPDANQVLADSYRLYVGGEKDVTFFLLAQKDYNDTIKQFLDTVVRHRRSMLSLNTAIGQRILP